MAYPSDLVRTKNWGAEVLTPADQHGQLDLIITWLMSSLDLATGHDHTGVANKSMKIPTGGIADDAITFALIDDNGNFGLFTGDWSFNEIALVEDAAPSTAASEMKLYTKDSGTQPELFVREESDGDEIQITKDGVVNVPAGCVVQVVNDFSVALQECTTVTPLDDSIPQIAEGDEVLSVSITPKNANNLLHIVVAIPVGLEDGRTAAIAALHKDGGAAVCAVSDEDSNAGAGATVILVMDYWVVAGGVVAQTWTVRVGTENAANDVWVNGAAGGTTRLFGGVSRASITITEIKA